MFVAVYNSSVWPNKFHCNVFFNFSSYQDQGQGLRYQPVRGQGSQFRGQFRGQGRGIRGGRGRGSQTSSPSDSSRSSSPSSYSNLQQVQEAVARFRFLNKRYPKK